ncbi:MAG: hypothetical protein RLN82_00100, partial [Pseudomonadales bacterium]
LLVFIEISSIIKPEKILLLKPVNLRGDYPGSSSFAGQIRSRYLISISPNCSIAFSSFGHLDSCATIADPESKPLAFVPKPI